MPTATTGGLPPRDVLSSQAALDRVRPYLYEQLGPPWARFDDLRAGTAVLCPPPLRVLVAERPEEVLDVLTEVEQATDSGQWAFGYVAYEAAAGLDPRLAVHGSTPMGMPLVWFGLCDEPVPVPPPSASRAGSAASRWPPG
jgi:para-aminobenzoate synthetase/4-amino-4-deoxychorismate lyase